MAIPKSTFVMGAVTLGLFGFATYRTLGSPDKVKDHSGYPDEEESIDDDDSEQSYEDYQKEREQRKTLERAEEEAARAKKLKAMHSLYGAEAATPGALFAGISIDGPADIRPAGFMQRRETFQDDTESTVQLGSGLTSDRFDRFEIRPGAIGDIDDREAMCEELQSGLRSAWGRGEMVTAAADATVWLNPIQKLRATIAHESRCELTFEHYVTPQEWVTKDAASVVPLSVIGQSVNKLVEITKVPAEENGDVVWSGPGVGIGTTPTSFSAQLERGKVTSITATTTASAATREELAAQLEKLFGKPKTSDDGYGNLTSTWSRPKLTLGSADGDTIILTIQK
jgi:hypothetical protein